MTHVLVAAMVADTALEQMCGTAFGRFNLVSGVTLLLASVIAGLLWDRFEAEQTFLAGAAFGIVAFAGLAVHRFVARPPSNEMRGR